MVTPSNWLIPEDRERPATSKKLYVDTESYRLIGFVSGEALLVFNLLSVPLSPWQIMNRQAIIQSFDPSCAKTSLSLKACTCSFTDNSRVTVVQASPTVRDLNTSPVQ